MPFSTVLSIVIRTATKKEKEENECSHESDCTNKINFRWTGGYYYCNEHNTEELESYISSDEEDSDSEPEEEDSELEEENSEPEEDSGEDYSTDDYSD